MAHYLTATVDSVRGIGSYVRLTIRARPIAEEMKPGQFVMISAGSELLLPRPFSIAHVDGDTVSIVFQGLGRGTDRLAALHPGDLVRILGPLGNSFSIDVASRPVIVAGGRGIAPFYELVRRIADRSPVLFYGGRSSGLVVEKEFFEQYCAEVFVTTEDGSAGRKGLLTTPLAEYLRANTPPLIYACGPHSMLHKVAEIADGVRTEFSMEARMACGYGICLGCVIPTGEAGYRRVCLEGPIFDAKEIRWKDLK